ncbi:MAG: helix-turn-helix domain-containing protein [bacterium]
MRKISEQQRNRVVHLRKKGKSIPEISKETGTSKTTVLRYVQHVSVLPEFQALLRGKQGGSRERSQARRESILERSSSALGRLSNRDLLFLLIGIYWGEGTKKDFSLINSDPSLICTFLRCLRTLNIASARLSLSLRLHDDIPVQRAKIFWARVTGLPIAKITRIEIIKGKKKGKLPYGMCRVRVSSGIQERLFVQSAIGLIGAESGKRLV